jgi:predicted enzyme related to lactoylglutathione lyase
MDIRRIIPNISSNNMDESKEFYLNFLGLNMVMDMHWVITFASPTNPTAQINIVKSDLQFSTNDHVTITIEVSDVDSLYEKAKQHKYEITYPITNEPWGVRRFWVRDPNGVTINLMTHIVNSEESKAKKNIK